MARHASSFSPLSAGRLAASARRWRSTPGRSASFQSPIRGAVSCIVARTSSTAVRRPHLFQSPIRGAVSCIRPHPLPPGRACPAPFQSPIRGAVSCIPLQVHAGDAAQDFQSPIRGAVSCISGSRCRPRVSHSSFSPLSAGRLAASGRLRPPSWWARARLSVPYPRGG